MHCCIQLGKLVGGTNQHAIKLVNLLQQFIDLCHFPAVRAAGPAQQKAVSLVQKQHGILLTGFGKGFSQQLFCAAHIAIQQAGGAFYQQRHAQGMRNMCSQCSLACSWRPIEAQTPGVLMLECRQHFIHRPAPRQIDIGWIKPLAQRMAGY